MDIIYVLFSRHLLFETVDAPKKTVGVKLYEREETNVYVFASIHSKKGRTNPRVRSPGRRDFVLERLIVVGLWHGTCQYHAPGASDFEVAP